MDYEDYVEYCSYIVMNYSSYVDIYHCHILMVKSINSFICPGITHFKKLFFCISISSYTN